jgi:hypothetical protein
MYPDATVDAVQTNQPVPRARGATMNWRSWASEVFSCSFIFFLLVGWDYLTGKTTHLGAHVYIWLPIVVVASSMGGVGFKELDRIGYRKAKHQLLAIFIALLVAPLILLFICRNFLHWGIALLNHTYLYFVIPFLVLWAAIFPLSLYLNRKNNKSLSQTTMPNAS